MAGRSPVRFLAPIALVAFAVALYTVVDDARGPAGRTTSDTPAQASGTPSKSSSASKKSTKRKRRFYTVKAGDTASGIAAKTGVSMTTMAQLNKHFDPQTLAPGQRIRLSK
jgi:LysM repeat protein